jgi:hypothetical protein
MSSESRSIIEALDGIRDVLENQTPVESKAVIETLNRIRVALEHRVSEAIDKIRVELTSSSAFALASPGADAIGSSIPTGIIEFPKIAQGPVEQVLAFTTDEEIFLRGVQEGDPFFSSHGVLVDFQHNRLPGMFSRLSFPIGNVDIRDVNVWPRPQPDPFDKPPQDERPTEKHGFSKQAYFFDSGSSSLVTVGPSLPKVIRLNEGGAQFWVGSTGVITQGTGKYEGARGISAYNGSSYFETWPESPDELFAMLQKGFKAFVSAYFKLVLKDHVIEPVIIAPHQTQDEAKRTRQSKAPARTRAKPDSRAR